jgi:hypothetical protein
MSRCNTIIAAALAAAALAAPIALAQPPDVHAGLSEPAPEGQRKQDLRMPDTRDAARATTPSDRNDARPETAGNPKISADAADSAPAKDYSKNAATGDKVSPAVDAALAQERYYSSYGAPEPLAPPRSPVASDDTPWLPIAPSIAATLAIVAAGAAHLRRLRNRRGCADRATT